MRDDANTKPADNPPSDPIQPTSLTGGQKVIQPTPGLSEELKAQKQQQVVQPAVSSTESPQPTYSQPTPTADGHMPIGMSASQMGLNEPKNKLFDINPKKLIIKSVAGLVVLGGLFAGLVATNIVALSEFKTVDYTNSKGVHYNLQFYSKHSTKRLRSGNTQLVSKVSKDGKFPITLSIAVGSQSGYARAKDCSGFTKVLDVQNDNLDQKISVCNFSLGHNTPNSVYVAGISYNNQISIVTISQDLSGVDLSSPSGAQQSLPKFGIEPYKDDIEKIVASIKVK